MLDSGQAWLGRRQAGAGRRLGSEGSEDPRDLRRTSVHVVNARMEGAV